MITREDPQRIAQVLCKTRGVERAQLYGDYRESIRDLCIQNTNTIPSQLQRVAVSQEVVTALASRLLVLRAFSTVFSNVPLQGEDKIRVPYYPLQSTASTDWVAGNGYVMGDTATSYKEIPVNKRKYQAVSWSSAEARRQPFLIVEKLAIQAADRLAYDMLIDVLSVVTNANFGAAAKTETSANWDSVDVADLKGVCDTAQWPDSPRALVTSSAYDVNLLKDSSIKAAMNYGGSEGVRDGRIPKLLGFDYHVSTVIPANGENLTGFCVYPSAVLVASAPIEPTREVRSHMGSYDTFVDSQTGAILEHRIWGNPDFDNTREVIEVNYGYAAGEAAALKRIVSA